MNKYANASSVHGAGRIKEEEPTQISPLFFIIHFPFFYSTLAAGAIAPFLSMLSDDCSHNRLNRLMDKTEEKPEQIGWSFDG